jgi:hypothetical protein
MTYVKMSGSPQEAAAYQTGVMTGASAIGVQMKNAAGTITCEAKFGSFDADGFTLNITTVTDKPAVRWVAYP